jgi:hypothetical protein
MRSMIRRTWTRGFTIGDTKPAASHPARCCSSDFESATADPRGEFPLRKPQTCRSSISLMRGVSIYSGASAPVNSLLDNITLI